MSDNLIIIIDEILKQQELCKLIHYNEKFPFEQPNLTLPANHLIRTDEKVLPYMFDEKAVLEEQSQLRVYYPEFQFVNGQVVENTLIHFDIICAKTLWLINVGGKGKIRPYEMIKYLVSHLYDRSIGTVGKLRFIGGQQLTVNEKFASIRVFADMMTL